MPLPFRLAAYYCAHFIHSGLFMAYFPLWLAWRGFGAVEIAWVLAAPQVMRTFAPAGWGLAADRTGALRALVALSCAGWALGFAALPFAEGFFSVLLVIGIASLLSAGALPLVEAITMGALAGQPGRYGPIRLWGSVGFIAAVLGGGAWLEAAPVKGLPWALAVFAFVAFAVALSLPDAERRSHAERVPWRLNRPIAQLLACGFFMAAAHGTLYAFLTLHLERTGYRVTTIGALWTLGVLAEIVVFFYLPALFRLHALSTILMASCALGVIRFQIIGWAADWLWLLLVAQVLHAATFGSYHAAAAAAVQRLFPPGAHSRGQALFSSLGYGAGGAAGAVSAGWAWQAAGPGFAFTVSSIAALAGLLFAYPLKRAGL